MAAAPEVMCPQFLPAATPVTPGPCHALSAGLPSSSVRLTLPLSSLLLLSCLSVCCVLQGVQIYDSSAPQIPQGGAPENHLSVLLEELTSSSFCTYPGTGRLGGCLFLLQCSHSVGAGRVPSAPVHHILGTGQWAFPAAQRPEEQKRVQCCICFLDTMGHSFTPVFPNSVCIHTLYSWNALL